MFCAGFLYFPRVPAPKLPEVRSWWEKNVSARRCIAFCFHPSGPSRSCSALHGVVVATVATTQCLCESSVRAHRQGRTPCRQTVVTVVCASNSNAALSATSITSLQSGRHLLGTRSSSQYRCLCRFRGANPHDRAIGRLFNVSILTGEGVRWAETESEAVPQFLSPSVPRCRQPMCHTVQAGAWGPVQTSTKCDLGDIPKPLFNPKWWVNPRSRHGPFHKLPVGTFWVFGSGRPRLPCRSSTGSSELAGQLPLPHAAGNTRFSGLSKG